MSKKSKPKAPTTNRSKSKSKSQSKSQSQSQSKSQSKSKSKSQSQSQSKRAGSRNPRNPAEQNFSQLRHEIFKFGLSGLDKKEQVDACVELALKLGAKPKKWIKPCGQLSADRRESQQTAAQRASH